MNWWYALMRKYVSAGIRGYFKEIKIVGQEHIPDDGPIMFTVNHQNAFLDALLIATSNNRHTHFLVRADVFRFGFMRRFFSSLNMMPVYRIRDGRKSLGNNQQIFKKCFKILDEEQALLLFPEANHHQNRFLLPLSKGFARIALGADNGVRIIPVGINYTHHRSFGGSVSIYYGKPISCQQFKLGNPRENRTLKQVVTQSMQQLITCIADDQHYEKLVSHLDQKPRAYLDPEFCNGWLSEVVPEHLPEVKKQVKPSVLRSLVRGLSWILNFPPLVINQLVLKRLRDPVFSSSVKFVSGIIIFPVYYLLLGLVAYPLWGLFAAIGVVVFCFLSLMARKYVLDY